MNRKTNLQPGLFDPPSESAETAGIVFYALGDFQSRGFELAGRKLALDRLLGAFRRAFERFDLEALSDGELAEILGAAGAKVEAVPRYVAKHPYRVTVPKDLAKRSLEFFESETVGKG